MVREDIAAEESLNRKTLYKVVLFTIKVIPMLVTLLYLFNTILSYYEIDCRVFSYIGGTSFLFIVFLYAASLAFRFCKYHRMFIHYISVNWLLDIIDYEYGIPISDKGLFLVYIVIAGIFLFLVLYYHEKEKKERWSNKVILYIKS